MGQLTYHLGFGEDGPVFRPKGFTNQRAHIPARVSARLATWFDPRHIPVFGSTHGAAMVCLGVKTTIDIDDNLLIDANKLAVATGRTLGAIIEESMREHLNRRESLAAGTPLPRFEGDGLHAGVDLDDSSMLLDVMDGVAGRATKAW